MSKSNIMNSIGTGLMVIVLIWMGLVGYYTSDLYVIGILLAAAAGFFLVGTYFKKQEAQVPFGVETEE